MIRSATAEANSNIALIKYWGKRDKGLNLPMNSSVSLTLDSQVKTVTTVSFSEDYTEDEFYFEGKRQEGKKFEKVKKHLNLIRGMADSSLDARVESRNTFPSGTGIASSASGFAALTTAACKALGLDLSNEELSRIARRGSGSAARCFYSGIVEWNRGEEEDGSDSYAVQFKDRSYWSELRDVIVIVDQEEKAVSSRDGMDLTVETSSLYKERLKNVDERIRRLKQAIESKDKDSLFSIIMEDSDEMHSTMLDTTPSLNYLNQTSEAIKELVKRVNEGGIKAGYTFDAGPNAHIITTSDCVDEIKGYLDEIQGVKKIIVCEPGEGVRMFEKMNNSCSVVKAYGKVLVYGGYSILDDGTGLVVNVDKGTTTKASFSENDKTEIIVSHIKSNEKDKLKFAEAAVEAARTFINSNRPLRIESTNDKELNPGSKAGFGSSATSSVSIIASILDLHSVDIESEQGRKKVYELSKEAHTNAQGKLGSGFDISAACFGTQFFSRVGIEKAAWPDDWNTVLAFTGKSASTVELVKQVNVYKEKHPEEYTKLMNEYNKVNFEARDCYKHYMESKDSQSLTRFIAKIEESLALRKLLREKAGVNIETEEQTATLDSLKRKGAMIAALPGAGGGDTILAVCKEDLEANIVKEYLKQNNLMVFENVNIADKPYEVLV